MASLKKLINIAKTGAEMNCINSELLPVLFLDTPNGLKILGEEFIPALELGDDEPEKIELQKEAVTETVRALLQEHDATQYVFIHEGYATEFVESAKKANYLVRNMPSEDRYDVATILAVKKGKPAEGHTAIIDSLESGKRKMRKWEKADQVEGRFAITDW